MIFVPKRYSQDVVGIAQLVRAPDCGSGGHRFDSDYPPHFFYIHFGVNQAIICKNSILGCRQAVRHSTLTAAFVGSNPATPAKNPVHESGRDFTCYLLLLP